MIAVDEALQILIGAPIAIGVTIALTVRALRRMRD